MKTYVGPMGTLPFLQTLVFTTTKNIVYYTLNSSKIVLYFWCHKFLYQCYVMFHTLDYIFTPF
jgi:hypothetical protein